MAFFFGRRRADGEILKAERMLVRIASIDDAEAKLPKEYSEGSHVNTRLKRVWREYYVVARVGESKHITLHIHKSRVDAFAFIGSLTGLRESQQLRIRTHANRQGGKSTCIRTLRERVFSPRLTRQLGSSHLSKERDISSSFSTVKACNRVRSGTPSSDRSSTLRHSKHRSLSPFRISIICRYE